MKGVLSAPAGPHRRICGDTDTPTHTHTPQGTSCKRYHFNFGSIYSASPNAASNHAVPQCRYEPRCPLTTGHLRTRMQSTHGQKLQRDTHRSAHELQVEGSLRSCSLSYARAQTHRHINTHLKSGIFCERDNLTETHRLSSGGPFFYEGKTSQLISSVSVQNHILSHSHTHTHTHTHCMQTQHAHTNIHTHTHSPLGSCVGPKPRPRVLFHGSIITSISLHINLSTAEHTGYYQSSPAPQRLTPKQTWAK